jgi:hypothetical protein
MFTFNFFKHYFNIFVTWDSLLCFYEYTTGIDGEGETILNLNTTRYILQSKTTSFSSAT